FLRDRCAERWAKRGDLVRAVCEAWSWRQVNGEWALHGCSDLLLRLEERGLVELPPPVGPRHRRERRRLAKLPLPADLIALTGLEVRDPCADLSKLCIRPILGEERLGWRLYMERYHYLGERPI